MHRGNLEELVKTILAMPPPKKQEKKHVVQTKSDESTKPVIKALHPIETKNEDSIDFINVKDLIKGMERQNKEPAVTPTKPADFPKETNGFAHKKVTDNGHDNASFEKSDKMKEEDKENDKMESNGDEIENDEVDKMIEKSESLDSYTGDESLSRSNSIINGAHVQPPKPLPRSSISEGGSGEEQASEVPKPKPRTTTVPISGYKVGLICLWVVICLNSFLCIFVSLFVCFIYFLFLY